MTRATIFFIINDKKYFIPADGDAYLTNNDGSLSYLGETLEYIVQNKNEINSLKDLRDFLKNTNDKDFYFLDLEYFNKEKRIGTYNYIIDLNKGIIVQGDSKFNNDTYVLSTINKEIVYQNNNWIL